MLAAFAIVLFPKVHQIVTVANRKWYADLTSESWEVQIPMLLVVVAVLIASSLSAVRSSRFRMGQWEGAQALPLRYQVAAQMLAVFPVSLLAFLVSVVWLEYLRSRPDSSGTVRYWELLTVGAMVLLAGFLGVALGRLTGSFPASLTIIGLLAVLTLIGLISDASGRWLGIAAVENSFILPPAPSGVVARPAAAHFVWLLSLSGLLLVALLFRYRLSKLVGYPLMSAVLAVSVLAAVVQLNSLQFSRVPPGATRCLIPQAVRTA